MRSPAQTPFGAVFQYEVILNSRRVAPYALFLLFAANAILWWGWSAAANFGWATNSDFNIVRNLQGFSFILGLPLFNALIMGDPVIRDFNAGFDPLIFSKPVSRASYLLGKFCANFFVLVCCQAAFVLTMLALQWFPTTRLVVLPIRVYPYFKHFFLIIVVSHLFLAAIFFTLATLKRNAKFAYGAALAFYPVYFAYQLVLLRNLPPDWRVVLDPMLLNSFQIPRGRWEDADSINQIVITYSSTILANRALIVVIVAIFLTILYFRFAITKPDRDEKYPALNYLIPDSVAAVLPEMVPAVRSDPFQRADVEGRVRPPSVPIPDTALSNNGFVANWRKLVAATTLELTLLRHEKSLMVLLPLSMLLSFLTLPFSAGVSAASHSAVFASNTARGLLLFLLGVVIFLLGEAMHRDREVRFEPMLWSTPAHNNVLLLSKFLAVLFFSVLLLVIIGLTAMLSQLLRGQTPIEGSTYLIVYAVILIPSLAFMAATSMALNVLLRDKYLCYAVTIAASSALFYLYSQGYNHWLYNPVIYGLWTETDLASWNRLLQLMGLRAYGLAIAAGCLVVAHVCFARKSN